MFDVNLTISIVNKLLFIIYEYCYLSIMKELKVVYEASLFLTAYNEFSKSKIAEHKLLWLGTVTLTLKNCYFANYNYKNMTAISKPTCYSGEGAELGKYRFMSTLSHEVHGVVLGQSLS